MLLANIESIPQVSFIPVVALELFCLELSECLQLIKSRIKNIIENSFLIVLCFTYMHIKKRKGVELSKLSNKDHSIVSDEIVRTILGMNHS